MLLVVNIWRREVFATMRLFASAETSGQVMEWVTAVGGVSSVWHCIIEVGRVFASSQWMGEVEEERDEVL